MNKYNNIPEKKMSDPEQNQVGEEDSLEYLQEYLDGIFESAAELEANPTEEQKKNIIYSMYMDAVDLENELKEFRRNLRYTFKIKDADAKKWQKANEAADNNSRPDNIATKSSISSTTDPPMVLSPPSPELKLPEAPPNLPVEIDKPALKKKPKTSSVKAVKLG